MILLDTNVISEAMLPKPEPLVLAWIDAQDHQELWTCTIVIAEVLSGLELMPDGSRQRQLRERAEYMFSTLFAERIFDLDLAAARAYGTVLRIRKSMGRPIDEMDGLIAATALTQGATLATRNIPGFEHCGIPLVNPWQPV
jgi:predicted nucleic acid-binding protein